MGENSELRDVFPREHFSQFGGSQEIKELPGRWCLPALAEREVASGGQVRLWENSLVEEWGTKRQF